MISSYLLAAGILVIGLPALFFAVRPWPASRLKYNGDLPRRTFSTWPTRQVP